MPTRAIPYVKVLVHLFCLTPVLFLVAQYRSGALAADPDLINSLTHLTGNWALWILLGSLAVTPLRRLHSKLSNLIRFRRLIGLYAFFYATLHLGTYVFLYSQFDVAGAFEGLKTGHPGVIWTSLKAVWPTMVDDVAKRRFIQIGLLAWAILFALAITSPAFVMRAMGGKRWQTLHRLVYGAAIAACIHYLWLVKSGVRAPWKDISVLVLLLLARLVWTFRNDRRRARMAVEAATGKMKTA